MEAWEKALTEFKIEAKEAIKEIDGRVDEVEKEIIVVKADAKSTNTRVDGLESTLKEINENTKWIKRAFIKGGISILCTLVVAIIIGLVTVYIKSLGG